MYRRFLVKPVFYVELNYGYLYVTKNGGTRVGFITKINSNNTSP